MSSLQAYSLLQLRLSPWAPEPEESQRSDYSVDYSYGHV